MKKVIVTGATGFIGKALVKSLLKSNFEVWAIARSPKKLEDIISEPNLKIIQADFNELIKLKEKISDKNFECFYHFAWEGCGYSSNDYNVQYKNIKYSCDAIELAISLNCQKFFFPESSHEYLKDKDGVLSNIYGIAKTCAKNMCKAIAKENNIIYLGGIFANVFGIGDYSNRSANTIIKKLLENKEIDLIEGQNFHEWTYIDDAIDAINKICEEGKAGNSYFIARKDMYTFREIILIAKKALSSKSKLNFGYYEEKEWIHYSEIQRNLIFRDTSFVINDNLEAQIINHAKWLKNN
ncbi:NAD(P)-dependent oxidoreductase [uncultured Megamonas sp.]|uniref:NAD-dependent epimerase/dehydratase family protein n=1 Tax=uncultured Megamonas sp. TaxID=286140 RepID=UPI002597DF1F|nr:NAD-dependent epimerase/dehydratase family protein [uncultured Megamonas sp.]